MPAKYLSPELKISKRDSKSRDLSLYNQKLILNLYATGNYTYYGLAKMLGIKRTTVEHTIHPELREIEAIRRRERRKTNLEAKAKRAENNKRYRERRKALYEQGKLQLKHL